MEQSLLSVLSLSLSLTINRGGVHSLPTTVKHNEVGGGTCDGAVPALRVPRTKAINRLIVRGVQLIG